LRCHDTQHDVTWHNDSLHNRLSCDTQHEQHLCSVPQFFVYAECHFIGKDLSRINPVYYLRDFTHYFTTKTNYKVVEAKDIKNAKLG
jgi:hypothetical protein